MRLRGKGTMELSQGKQSKSRKKAERRGGEDKKKRGGWNSHAR